MIITIPNGDGFNFVYVYEGNDQFRGFVEDTDDCSWSEFDVVYTQDVLDHLDSGDGFIEFL